MTPSRALLLAGFAALAMLAACAPSPDDARLRFEAERARWKLDRLEHDLGGAAATTGHTRERLRAAHAELAERFAPNASSLSAKALSEDERVRYHIAGSSALFAAVLGEGTTPDDSLRVSFAAIAERFSFDPEIAVRARVHEGLAAEVQGLVEDALATYAVALDHATGNRAGNTVPEYERLRADLEVHAALLALERWPSSRASEWIDTARDRLGERCATWHDAAGLPSLQRRFAELLAISGDAEKSVLILNTLLETEPTAEGTADLSMRTGEVEEHIRKREVEAEVCYRRAASAAVGRPVGAEARLLLGDFLLHQGRAREAVDAYTMAIASSLAAGAAFRAEAMYGRGIALESWGRWEDAIPALSKASKETGPFAIAASARLAHRFREISHPEAEAVTRSFVARAASADSTAPRALRDLGRAIYATREAAAWRVIHDELAVLSAAPARGGVADSARTARQRIVARGVLEARIPTRTPAKTGRLSDERRAPKG